jgi:photosystem II stability/assembly factor-like uncharacterized protein
MKKVILFLVIVFGLGSGPCVKAEELDWEDISTGSFDFRSVWIDPVTPNFILAGSRSGIARSENGGISWRSVLSVRGEKRGVNYILSVGNNFYACTENGLYLSSDRGRNWKRIFKGRNAFEADCRALTAAQGQLFLGTGGGLFISRDNGRIWQRVIVKPGGSGILVIISKGSNVYAACADGVFKSRDNGDSWERVYSKHSTEISAEAPDIVEDRDEGERCSSINYLAFDAESNRMYLATSSGVMISNDEGRSWENLSDYGLLSKDVRKIFVFDNSDIRALTQSGIFAYRDGRWQEESFGLSAGDVRFLGQDNSGILYAACEKGLFRGRAGKKSRGFFNTPPDYDQWEPKINEVQKAAISYAEVDPEKIRNWRRQAGKKALLPDMNISVGRNTSDLWHWESGSSTKSEDDILRKGNDAIDWDVSLSWDLGELIWNNDQTSIDTRSRLMVQLRDDILDEVNKAYFERIRLREEINNLTIEDRKRRFEKELRLRELTATLDSLTGGLFSQTASKY